MPIVDKRVFDGFDTLSAGVNAGRRAGLIDKNQCAEADNVVFRGGCPATRPGFRKRNLTFVNTLYYDSDGNRITQPEGVVVSGSGNSGANAFYTERGTSNAKPYYNIFGQDDDTINYSIVWTGTIWAIKGIDNTTLYYSNDNVDYPYQVTTWLRSSGALPLPTVVAGQDGSHIFADGIFQGASYYAPSGMTEQIIVQISGRLFQIILRGENDADVYEIPLDKRNSVKQPLAYMVQADRFLIIQDGQSAPIIFNGVSARRAQPTGEVPVGTIMAYGMGRLVVTTGSNIYFGDLYGSHPGDPAESVLLFTETTFLNEGGPASLSFALGAIKGAVFPPQQDSATGDGELLISAEGGFSSFFLSQPREEWKQSAFQRVSLLNIGGRGHRAFVSVNGDMWFRAVDGWRTYRQARAEITGWAHLPLSSEISQHTKSDTQEFLDYASAINFDNRLIATVAPRPNQGRLYHNGLVSLDFDVLSAFGDSSRPAWDGHWSGLKTCQLLQGSFVGRDKAFAFVIDSSDDNILVELTTSDRKDFTGSITARLDLRALNFDSPYNEKHSYQGDLWFDDISEDVSVDVDYRPDQRPDWVDWDSFSMAAVGTCQAINCGGCPTIRLGFEPRKTLKKPANDFDTEHTGRLMRRFYELQTRIQWTGHAAIRRFRAQARMEVEEFKHVP